MRAPDLALPAGDEEQPIIGVHAKQNFTVMTFIHQVQQVPLPLTVLHISTCHYYMRHVSSCLCNTLHQKMPAMPHDIQVRLS